MSDPDDNRRAVYQELCNSYRAIDDFRAKLLGFLPLATGTGIFLLLDKLKDLNDLTAALGVFGFVITLGLFAYEIYGIKKCDALIWAGQQLEGELRSDGQFFHRPREVIGFINEPFAAGIIYPAVAAAWIFLALVSVLPQPVGSKGGSTPLPYAIAIALLLFLFLLAWSLFYNFRLKSEGKVRADLASLNALILEAEEDGEQAELDPLIAHDFTIVRANGVKQDRKEFLEAVSTNAHRGRTADHLKILPFGDCAVVTCRVTASQNKDGAPTVSHYWNTRVFIRQTDGWQWSRSSESRYPRDASQKNA